MNILKSCLCKNKKYSLFIILLIGFTALCGYALHYRIKPNHIIETVLFFVLVHRFSPKVCRILLVVSAVLVCLYYPIGLKYGEISTAAVFSVMYTNKHEAWEFLQNLNILTISIGFLFGIIILLFAFWVKRLPPPPGQIFSKNFGNFNMYHYGSNY